MIGFDLRKPAELAEEVLTLRDKVRRMEGDCDKAHAERDMLVQQNIVLRAERDALRKELSRMCSALDLPYGKT